jgi:hypothetical protein
VVETFSHVLIYNIIFIFRGFFHDLLTDTGRTDGDHWKSEQKKWQPKHQHRPKQQAGKKNKKNKILY